jgi:hypothetical protein
MTNPYWTCHNRVSGAVCILLVSGILVGGSFAVGADAQLAANEKSAPVAETNTVAQTAPASSRQPGKTPAYLKQMPEPERVIADIRGSDDLNTAARQVAALNRLIDVVITLSGTADAPGGPRLTTEEQNLNGRYARAASSLLTAVYRSIDPDNKQQSDENSKRNQWNRLRDRYGDDEAFISALLQRYLTPDLEKQYLGYMRQTRQNIQALNQHIQTEQNIQAQRQHIQAAAAAARIATHNSNMNVSTTNHIVWIVFLVVCAIGTFRLIRSKTHQETTNAIGYSRSSQASSRAAPTPYNTMGSKPVERCDSCSGSGKQTCFACQGRGRITIPAYAPHAGTSDGWCAPCGGSGKRNCDSCGGSGTRR